MTPPVGIGYMTVGTSREAGGGPVQSSLDDAGGCSSNSSRGSWVHSGSAGINPVSSRATTLSDIGFRAAQGMRSGGSASSSGSSRRSRSSQVSGNSLVSPQESRRIVKHLMNVVHKAELETKLARIESQKEAAKRAAALAALPTKLSL
eukprot:TRINITY_DN19998_c0_g1_i2.p2 TRINITY_DN19998_c0_g1~~TRINITY_DN19998_c0_g1_i2.p2  ORF type:complete len:148 (-),score=24.38 TRINITY_DN19998_c0_g1_i2:231-674(-)